MGCNIEGGGKGRVRKSQVLMYKERDRDPEGRKCTFREGCNVLR